MSEDQQFYVGQKALIVRNDNILLLNDATLPNEIALDLPGGKIQEGELDFTQAFLREIHEETSLRVKIQGPFTTSYFHFPIIDGAKNSGRKIYIVVFLCSYVSGDVLLSDEHNAYYWVNQDNFGKHFIKKTNIYDILQLYFKKSGSQSQ